MENMEKIFAIKNKAEEMEVLNKTAEDAETEEEKQGAIERMSRLEEVMDKMEEDLGLNEEDAEKALKIYTSSSPDEINNILEELSDEEKKAVKSGNTENIKSFMSKLPGSKTLRLAVCFLALTLGAQFAHAGESADKKEKQQSAEMIVQNNFEELKFWCEKNNIKIQEDELKEMAKLSRQDKVYEILEKRFGLSGVRSAAKTVKKMMEEPDQETKNAIERLREEIKKEADREDSREKPVKEEGGRQGIISSGEGADKDAW
jgi:hypothetical protein